MNKTLILDVGGVLASNLSPGLWQQLASHGGINGDELYRNYKHELSSKLWCGEISVPQWWNWLAAQGVHLSEKQKEDCISTHLQPLPALQKLKEWSNHCHIVIMSNHRTEWLMPLLSPFTTYIERIYISDQAKQCKPNVSWFLHISKTILPTSSIRFVDDSHKNLAAANSVGWQTTYADPDGSWTKAIDQWLHSTA